MQLYYGASDDMGQWMALVTRVRQNFPGLETREQLADYRSTVLRFMGKRQAICVKENDELAGVMLFSRGHNMICCLAVAPEYRRRGVASMLMDEALRQLDRTREISVSTFRADDEKGPAPRGLYEKYGFVADALTVEFDYPQQLFVLHPSGAERKARQLSVNSMVREISRILADCDPTIYMYGSCALDDFRLGWSDIDILVLTERQMSQSQAMQLAQLRQTMLAMEPSNPYYRSFEGGILTRSAFLTNACSQVVYWGTGGQRITDRYSLDSFGLAGLTESGILLHGRDIRPALKHPGFPDLLADVQRHYDTIRQHARHTGRSLYAYGWLLDIARCIYTLRTGKIIAKTAAGQWALENSLCPDTSALAAALTVRNSPLKYRSNAETLDYAETLGGPIQRFADVLEKELNDASAAQKLAIRPDTGFTPAEALTSSAECAVLSRKIKPDDS